MEMNFVTSYGIAEKTINFIFINGTLLKRLYYNVIRVL